MMSHPDDRALDVPEPTAATDTANGDIPSGNLFATPKLTALDPADKAERDSVERLLESLDEPA